MLNIISHWENANQNHNKIPLHTHLDGKNNNNKTENSKCCQGCRVIGYPVHGWWECKTVQQPQKGLTVPQKLNIELPHDPTVPLLGINTIELETGNPKNTGTCMFTEELSQYLKTTNNLDAHQQMNG